MIFSVVDWTAIAAVISSTIIGLSGIGLAGWTYWDTTRLSLRKLLRDYSHTMLSESATTIFLARQLRGEVRGGHADKGLVTMTAFRSSMFAMSRAKSFLDLLVSDAGADLLIAASRLAGASSALAPSAADESQDLDAAVKRVTDARNAFRRLVITEQEMSWRDRRTKRKA